MDVITLELARGNGWAARRSDGLLWTPADRRPDALLDAFFDATDGDAATGAVTSAVVDAEFHVDPFTVVVWADELHVVVMGPLEVGTDVPSMPMLSGGRSTTWVEHRPSTSAATIAAGEEPDLGTELGAGVVRAGGFRLAVTTAVAEPARVPTTARRPDEGVSLLRSVTGGDWMEDSIGVSGPELVTAEATISPDDFRARGDHGDRTRRSSAGTIVIDGAPAADLDTVAVIGRHPDPGAAGVDARAAVCTVTGNPAVSRTHLIVRYHDGAVSVTDCGSSSGSVLFGPGRPPVTLEPWTAYPVDADDTVYLAGSTAVQIQR